MSADPRNQPSAARVVRVLKEGYWDRTEIIELADGNHRVRKRNTPTTVPGEWGIESLRREIQYLIDLPPQAAKVLPPVLAYWDREHAGRPDLGYEMPLYSKHTDAGAMAQHHTLSQFEIDEFQAHLAQAVLHRLHQPLTSSESFSCHVITTMQRALDQLTIDPEFAELINAPNVWLNDQQVLGPRAALAQLTAAGNAFSLLDRVHAVRLHGDLFLENILWRQPGTHPATVPSLILLDPVSVAGISVGPPHFDLVKYESYATGELLALRTERVDVAGFSAATGRYAWRIHWTDPAIQRFRSRDWHRRFRLAFETKYGAVDPIICFLIDSYFSLAMALNTSGVQRQARLLKATSNLNSALGIKVDKFA